MSCGEAVEVREKYWGWCGWRPCRKTRTVTKFRYELLPWRTRFVAPFRGRYEGCCKSHGHFHKYTVTKVFAPGNSAWNTFVPHVTIRDNELASAGPCPHVPS